eukprot:m.70541 g.70541  ORF g.70541 m.70541 type:complete len:803 (+) comp13779_c1_seq1:3620-6028(+)
MLLEQEAEAMAKSSSTALRAPYSPPADKSNSQVIVAQLPRRDESEWKTKPPLTWKPRHSANWLTHVAPELAHIASKLEDNGVHGAELLKLGDTKLKSFGIVDAKERKAFKAHIKQLKATTRKGLEAGYTGSAAPERAKSEVYIAVAGFPGHPGRNQLSFREGDEFTLLQEVSKDWYEMRLHRTGLTGLVPANYVQHLQAPERDSTQAPALQAIGYVQAVADFKGAAGQLALLVGQEFAVLQQRDANWIFARDNSGHTGLVPHTYVKEIPDKRKLLVIQDYVNDEGVLVAAKGEILRQAGWTNNDQIVIHTAAGHTHHVPRDVVVEHHPDYGFDREMEAVTAFVGGEGKLSLSPGDKIVALTMIAGTWIYGFHPRTSTYGFVPISFLRDLSEEPIRMNVIAPYDAQGRPGYVSVRVGQQVELLKEVSADWCVVQVSSRERGLVPRGYLEKARQESTTEIMRTTHEYRNDKSSFFLFEGEVVTVLQQASDDWFFVRRANGEEGMAPALYLQPATVFYKAVADFDGQRNSSQLSFSRNDMFVLLSFKSNDWLQARNSDGRVGLIPAVYVEEVAPPDSFAAARGELVPPVERGHVANRARVFSTPQRATTTSTPQRRESLMRTPSVHRLKSAYSRHALLPHAWTSLHVLDWLVTLPIDTKHVERVFEVNGIEGQTLLELGDRDLRAMGIKDRLTREELLNAIDSLKSMEEEKRLKDTSPVQRRAPQPHDKDSLRHRAASAGLVAQLNQLHDPQAMAKKKGKHARQDFALQLALESQREAERQERHQRRRDEEARAHDMYGYHDEWF